jgi:signal transduction histidine kinase
MKKVFFGFYFFILASMLFIRFAIGPLINKFAEEYLHDKTTEYNQRLSKGVFYLMEEDLLRLPQDKWADRVKDLQPRFGYGISLTSYHDLTIANDQKELLHKGMIAVIGKEEYVYKQVGDSDLVLGKGPFSAVKPTTGYLLLYIWIFIPAILALITILWIIPYWRKLRKISSAAIAFGNGDFNVRADISKRSSLAPIAVAFNTMAEHIQQLISSHKELTNGVSHELRTPISRIRFGLEMLESSTDPEKRKHYSQGLQADVNELEELVTELLTFARFDREKPELHFRVQHLESWLSQLLSESQPSDGPILCQVFFNINSPSCQVNIEPKYMARALGNLTQNALCYAKQRLMVTVERSDNDCCIHIDDDGPGIPIKDRVRIFEPFTRLDVSRSRVSGGYGLGLAIVSKIIAWHNGRITVCDSPLGGARFTLRWPGFVEN